MDRGTSGERSRETVAGDDGAVPRVAVITPCFNAADYLPRAVASVRRQSFTAWEMVIVDDGSTDGRTRELARSLVDDRVRLIERPQNRGPGIARNAGIRDARADIIVPVDADDELPPDALATIVAAFDADPTADFVYGHFVRISPDGAEREIRPVATGDPGILPWVPMSPFRRRLWERAGGYEERASFMSGAEDWIMWLRAVDRRAQGTFLPDVLLRHHMRRDSLNVEVRPLRVQAVLEVFDELHDLIVVCHAREALSWTARKAATYWRVRGRPWRAIGFLLATIGRMPRRTDVWRTLLGCLAESAIPPLRRRYTTSRVDSHL